ncbi:pirin family protein [Faecalibacter macacae]|uniref:Pirin family protein n=1 Tax=Faecalibacter macacae TaxID=1859289 RepID=A0A3L9MF54_9FLAO|nr:pirin family protein [Faecalibacter macacae]RLZ11528.1 pirin family protein [Faecalibacter macacae]
MKNTVLITGANSFIAKHIIPILSEKYQLKFLTRNPKLENEFQWDFENKTIDEKALDNVDYIIHLAYKGKIAHKDSRGNHGVIGEGDVQWMTAGAGILHQEYHEEEWSKQGGMFQMVQIWMNLPAKDRETPPHYQDVLYNDMTKVVLNDEVSYINIIAGEYNGQKGKATTYSPINMYNAYLQKGAIADFDFLNYYNTAILIIDGSVKVNGEEVLEKDSFAMFENEKGDTFSLEALSDNTLELVLSGEPLNEPIAHYGPFVMNTQEQLVKAFEEFKAGKFGTL